MHKCIKSAPLSHNPGSWSKYVRSKSAFALINLEAPQEAVKCESELERTICLGGWWVDDKSMRMMSEPMHHYGVQFVAVNLPV